MDALDGNASEEKKGSSRTMQNDNTSSFLSAADQQRVAQFGADIQSLISLDDTWTKQATLPHPTPQDITSAQATVEQMKVLLLQLENQSDWFQGVVDSVPETQFEQAITQAQVNEQQKQLVRQYKQQRGGGVASIKKALQDFKHHAPAERAELDKKVHQLSQQQQSSGDMSPEGRCWLGWAALGSGAILGAWPVAGAGIVLIAANC